MSPELNLSMLRCLDLSTLLPTMAGVSKIQPTQPLSSGPQYSPWVQSWPTHRAYWTSPICKAWDIPRTASPGPTVQDTHCLLWGGSCMQCVFQISPAHVLDWPHACAAVLHRSDSRYLTTHTGIQGVVPALWHVVTLTVTFSEVNNACQWNVPFHLQ